MHISCLPCVNVGSTKTTIFANTIYLEVVLPLYSLSRLGSGIISVEIDSSTAGVIPEQLMHGALFGNLV